MKKCIQIIFFIVFFLSGCNADKSKNGNKQNEQRTGEFFFITEKVYEILLDSSDVNSPKYSTYISLYLMQSDDSKRQESVNNAIIRAAFGFEGLTPEQSIDSFLNIARIEYRELFPDYIDEKHAGGEREWFNHTFELKSQVDEGRNGVINYKMSSFTYSGGAHPNTNYSYINFDKNTGKEILLNDIFVDKFEDKLDIRLIEALAKKIGANSIKEIKEKGFLTFNDIFVSENFLLTKDSILFLYNSYDIAPYVAGTTLLGFKYEELSDILK